MLSIVSVFASKWLFLYLQKNNLPLFFFVVDSNKILALFTALCSFMWFKDLKVRQSKIINTTAAATFGVLLIHANSDAMRQWLWHDTLQNAKVYYMDYFAMHAVLAVIGVFVICVLIDICRIKFIEPVVFKWIDKRFGNKMKKIDEVVNG